MSRRSALACALLCSSCQDGEVKSGVMARFDPAEDAGFYDAPFPIAHRSRDDGSLVVADFPGADQPGIEQVLALLEEGRGGFSLNGAVLVPFDGAIDATRLPADPAASLEPEASVFLVDIDPDSPRKGERIPIETSFKKDAESFSPANLLVALPYAGFVLAPRTHYALLVQRGLGDVDGRPLYPPEALVDALAGFLPAGPLRSAFEVLRGWLSEAGLDSAQIAAATVFETGDPIAEIVEARSEPEPPMVVPRLIETQDGYCAFAAGDLTIAVPHADMPASGFPLVLYLGADDSELLDENGPARFYAARGLASASPRAPEWSSDSLRAFRDGVIASIHDVTNSIALGKSVVIDAALCPDATTATGSFTFDRTFVHGQSNGSVVASASIALEPDLDAAVLSGAAGSWIHRTLSGSPFSADTFGADDRFDPALTLFQTAFDAIEPMSWAARVVREPLMRAKQMLLIQGVPDSRHAPRAINAYAMGVGLDLVMPEIEPSARADYELAGRSVFPSPITGNITGIGAQLLTAATIQHGSSSDGHRVIFEVDEVKHRYSCFVASMAEGGTGTVPAPASDPLDPCP